MRSHRGKGSHLTLAFVVRKFLLISFLQFHLNIIHFHWSSFPFIHLDHELAAMANGKHKVFQIQNVPYRIVSVSLSTLVSLHYINMRVKLESIREKDPWKWFSYIQKTHTYQRNSIARNCFLTQDPFNDYFENFHRNIRMNEKKHKYIECHPFTQL